jgi:hypothetical protein
VRVLPTGANTSEGSATGAGHPHLLRHTYITSVLDVGVDLRDVRIARPVCRPPSYHHALRPSPQEPQRWRVHPSGRRWIFHGCRGRELHHSWGLSRRATSLDSTDRRSKPLLFERSSYAHTRPAHQARADATDCGMAGRYAPTAADECVHVAVGGGVCKNALAQQVKSWLVGAPSAHWIGSRTPTVRWGESAV